MRSKHITLIALVTCISATAAHAAPDEARPPLKWTGTTAQGGTVSVPAKDQPSLMLFVRADQPQSREVLRTAARLVTATQPAQVVVVVSGPKAMEQSRAFIDQKITWPIVLDVDYATSGLLNVHAWPTLTIIDSAGGQVAYIAGVTDSLAHDLDGYLQFAAGKIDRPALDKHLAERQIAGTTVEEKAARHLQVAIRLIDNARYDEADVEIEQGLKFQPDGAALKVAQARVLALRDKPREALQVLSSIPAGAVPACRIDVVRGRALVALAAWPEAKSALLDALKLNPDPAEAHYLLGVVHENQKDWPAAAASYRKAFEASWRGPKVK